MNGSALRPLVIRKALGRDVFDPPEETIGGWVFTSHDGQTTVLVVSIKIDQGEGEGLVEWVSAQVSHPAHYPPTDEMEHIKRAVYGEDGWAYESYPPTDDEKNRAEYTRRLWGRADHLPVLPRY